jgi:hypothetical protein
LALKLSHLVPDENGMVTIVSGNKNAVKFNNKITYEKALTHVLEGSAGVLNTSTIVKYKSFKQLRKHILKRDNHKCHYCGKQGHTVDHKKPRSKGGCSTPANLVCCCTKCNRKKRDMDYSKFIKQRRVSL